MTSLRRHRSLSCLCLQSSRCASQLSHFKPQRTFLSQELIDDFAESEYLSDSDDVIESNLTNTTGATSSQCRAMPPARLVAVIRPSA